MQAFGWENYFSEHVFSERIKNKHAAFGNATWGFEKVYGFHLQKETGAMAGFFLLFFDERYVLPLPIHRSR